MAAENDRRPTSSKYVVRTVPIARRIDLILNLIRFDSSIQDSTSRVGFTETLLSRIARHAYRAFRDTKIARPASRIKPVISSFIVTISRRWGETRPSRRRGVTIENNRNRANVQSRSARVLRLRDHCRKRSQISGRCGRSTPTPGIIVIILIVSSSAIADCTL